MTERDRKLAGVASLLVTISVAANMIAFQDKGQGSIIETGGLGARTAWVDGPGLNLGSAVTVPVAAQPPAPVAQGPSNDAGDISSAEITRGIQRELNSRGYEAGQPDGVAGLVTRAAIFAYEYDNDLVLIRQAERSAAQPDRARKFVVDANQRPARQTDNRRRRGSGHHGEAATLRPSATKPVRRMRP